MDIAVVDVLANRKEPLHYQLTLSNGGVLGIREEAEGTLVIDNYSHSFDLFVSRMTAYSVSIATKPKEQA
jgi:hypothetical protein